VLWIVAAAGQAREAARRKAAGIEAMRAESFLLYHRLSWWGSLVSQADDG
ncbi:unnamed protein product, partial [marine sediment metagenome]